MSKEEEKMLGTSLQNEVASLLPFYITGRLGLRDQMRVELWLKDNPRGQKALDNAYADQRASIDANEAIASPTGALGRLLKDIDAEPSQAWSNYVGGNMLSWIKSWLNIIPSTLAWGAVAALLLVTVTQSTLLLQKGTHIPFEVSNGKSGSATNPELKGTSAFIRFAPNTGINDISSLLSGVGAILIDGPRGKNTYVIHLKKDKNLPSIKDRLAKLGKHSDLVHFIAEKKD
ncbi:MAG: hypothetical protein GY927_18025 [bacterium]|nr:hypothetical protein [bacterium]